ncbi:MAG: PilT/PilU family type 4a pilus ATPase [Kofleriaceae bacterium]|nr:PilT/PilU family type 4a pilus ATPase [Kofleriaceae bacterium]
MSAIVSLLRVMTLRDADAITIESGRVPTLRRRGQVEALAMPALDEAMLGDFVAPLLAGKPLAGTLSLTYTDEGVTYPLTVEKTDSGLRLVVRRPAPAAKPPLQVPPVAPRPVLTAVPTAPAPRPMRSLDALAQLLSPAVAYARAREASDVILSSGQAPRMRVDGRVETVDVPIDDAELSACVAAFASNGPGVSHDVALELDGIRVRVNAFDHLGGHAIAARLVRERVPSLSELALPSELASIVEHRDGLVLVCGPTGSGKSTTLAALVEQLDQRRSAHVITLEDPIEYQFRPRRCLVHQRELGTHIPSFAAGLRSALREAPDVILLGELRDRETLAAALTAAETGHLVLATLHAPSAIGAIDRMIDAFPETQQRQVRSQLSACLRTIVTQYLLPRRDGGRVAAIELVPVTPAVANIIRKGELQTLPTAIQSGRDVGMIALERSLARLLDANLVTAKAVQRVANDPDLMAALAGKLR